MVQFAIFILTFQFLSRWQPHKVPAAALALILTDELTGGQLRQIVIGKNAMTHI